MVYEPLTTLMYHLLDDMIDGECFRTCVIERGETCLKKRKVEISCFTAYAQDPRSPCKAKCENATFEGTTCEVSLESAKLLER